MLPSPRFRTRSLCAITLLLCGCPAVVKAVTADDVLQAWEQREKDTKSFRFVCEVEQTLTAGNQRPKPSFLKRPAEAISVPQRPPTTDTRLKVTFTYAAKEGRAFYSEDGDHWDIDMQKIVHRSFKQNYDQLAVRSLYDVQNDRQIAPAGTVSLGEPDTKVHRNSFSGLLGLTYRPISQNLRHPEAGATSDTFCLRDSRSATPPDGIVSVAFWHPQQPDSVNYVWSDSQRNFLPVRWLRERSGWIVFDQAVEYVEDEEGNWLPATWKSQQFNPDGSLRESRTAVVRQASVNTPAGDADFEIVFPQGAWVDEIRGRDKRSYLVMEDGNRRYLHEDEADIRKYDQLIDPSRSSKRVGLIVSIAAAIIMCILLFIVLYGARRKHESIP